MSGVNVQDLRADWVEHPYSGLARKRADEMRAAAMSSLRGACSQSTDPKVRGAFDRLQAIESCIDLLTHGVK